jgi:hypothetical protein
LCGVTGQREEEDEREKSFSGPNAGLPCQMVYFQTKNRNLDKYWRALQWKMLVYFMDIWYILRPVDVFNGHWYI